MDIAELKAMRFPHVPESEGLDSESKEWVVSIDQFLWTHVRDPEFGENDRTHVCGSLTRAPVPSYLGSFRNGWHLGPLHIITLASPELTDLVAAISAMKAWEDGSVYDDHLVIAKWRSYVALGTYPDNFLHWALVVPTDALTSDIIVEALRRLEVRGREEESDLLNDKWARLGVAQRIRHG